MLSAVAQATAVLLLLPVLVSLRGLSLQELPQYVSDGTLGQLPDTALQRLTNPGTKCTMPGGPVGYRSRLVWNGSKPCACSQPV